MIPVPTPLTEYDGTAGGMGRMDEVRFGGEPGVSEGVVVAFWRALSSQEDFVGDQRLREKSVE